MQVLKELTPPVTHLTSKGLPLLGYQLNPSNWRHLHPTRTVILNPGALTSVLRRNLRGDKGWIPKVQPELSALSLCLCQSHKSKALEGSILQDRRVTVKERGEIPTRKKYKLFKYEHENIFPFWTPWRRSHLFFGAPTLSPLAGQPADEKQNLQL